jgi:hypothetical protein
LSAAALEKRHRAADSLLLFFIRAYRSGAGVHSITATAVSDNCVGFAHCAGCCFWALECDLGGVHGEGKLEKLP